MTARDEAIARIASVLHMPCEASWAIAATKDPDRLLTLHGTDAHHRTAELLLNNGIGPAFDRDAMLQALDHMAASPTNHPAGPWVSLPVARSIVNGTHPVLVSVLRERQP